MGWRKDIVQVRWREEGTDDEFKDFGDSIMNGTLRWYERPGRNTGYEYKAVVEFDDQSTFKQFEELRTAPQEKRIDVQLDLRGGDEPFEMTCRAKVKLDIPNYVWEGKTRRAESLNM